MNKIKIRAILYLIFPMLSENKIYSKNICESCGEEFPCGVESEKCWCFEVAVAPETLTTLERDFKNCLCEDCLAGDRRKTQSSN